MSQEEATLSLFLDVQNTSLELSCSRQKPSRPGQLDCGAEPAGSTHLPPSPIDPTVSGCCRAEVSKHRLAHPAPRPLEDPNGLNCKGRGALLGDQNVWATLTQGGIQLQTACAQSDSFSPEWIFFLAQFGELADSPLIRHSANRLQSP